MAVRDTLNRYKIRRFIKSNKITAGDIPAKQNSICRSERLVEDESRANALEPYLALYITPLQSHRLLSGFGDKVLSNGESDEIRVRFQPKILHNSIFVKCDRPHCDIQNSRCLLHRSALCKQ